MQALETRTDGVNATAAPDVGGIRPLEVCECDGWRLRVYGIADGRDTPRPELVRAAKQVARARLPRRSDDNDNTQMGFLGIHDGVDWSVVFVSWWANPNELHHHVYSAPADCPEELVVGWPDGAPVRRWDLAVAGIGGDDWSEPVIETWD